MRSTSRSLVGVLGILTLCMPAVVAAQARQQPAQRGGQPGPDTRRVLIATFFSSAADKKLGVEASDELRKRAQDQYSIKQFWVVPKPEMDNLLKGSGFNPDSALSTSDAMELGRGVRADYIVAGEARKTSDGVVIEPKLQLRRGNVVLTQPLTAITAKNLGDVTKSVMKALDDVLKAMPSYLACEAELRAGRYEVAATNARANIAAYPASTLGRLCLLSAFQYSKAPADSILRVADEILATDSTSSIALTNAYDAAVARNDTARAVAYGKRAWRLDKGNRELITALVNLLVGSGKLDDAVSLINEALDAASGDASLLKVKMQLLLRLKRYKEAIAVGDELGRVDAAAITAEIIGRLAAAAALDSQPALAVSIYERGIARFPNDADLHLAYAQSLAKVGKLAEALRATQRAVTIKPTVESGYLFILSYHLQLGQLDSAVATAPAAVANGADKKKVADMLVAAILPAVSKAQTSKLRSDWQTALATAQRVDGAAPSAGSKFYIGVSAYNIGADAVSVIDGLNQQLRTAKPAAQKDLRAKACVEAKVAEDNFATASISVAAGGSFEPATAAQLMTGLQQSSGFVSQAKTLFCK